MVRLLSETEGDPASWPSAVERFPVRETDLENPPIPAAVTWRRIEAWTARRWPARSVTWILEGPGEWSPRLFPFTLSTAERWIDGDGWTADTLDAAPLGWELDAATYRIAGTAGDDADPPEDVIEAWKRLHEYQLGIARSYWTEPAEFSNEAGQAVAAWAAKAISLSGAADLLRPYRGLGR